MNIFKYISLITIVGLTIIMLGLSLAPTALAAETECEYGEFEMPLPGLTGDKRCIDKVEMGEYLNILAKFIIAMIVSVGLIMVVGGGYVYMTAGGSADRVTTAKKMIGSALLGIVLALASYVILNTINPQLVEFEQPVLNLPSPKPGN